MSSTEQQNESLIGLSSLNDGLGTGRECYACGDTYEYTEESWYTSCDTIDGQYVECQVTKCPVCGCENW